MADKLCPDCDQPMLPAGMVKRPNEYDHARGCPARQAETIIRLPPVTGHDQEGSRAMAEGPCGGAGVPREGSRDPQTFHAHERRRP
jgi:hypothetical protein